MRLIYITLFLLLAGLALNSQAREVQKWVDKDGQVHYGDYSESSSAKTVKVPSGPAVSTTAPTTAQSMEKRSKFLDAKEAERKQQKEDREQAKKQQAKAETNCNISKSQYNMLKDGGRLVTHDAKGERHYLTDAERNKKMAEAQKAVSKWCK